MQFRLTYAGELKSHRDDRRLAQRSHHVHDIRQQFHKQLKVLWSVHPVLTREGDDWMGVPPEHDPIFEREGYRFKPIVTETNGLICEVEILMLRSGALGKTLDDLDNRLKTLFDALRMPRGSDELGLGTQRGQRVPGFDEDPFYVVLENDNLITRVAVTSDTLLDEIPDVAGDVAVRLVVNVTIRPYKIHIGTLAFS